MTCVRNVVFFLGKPRLPRHNETDLLSLTDPGNKDLSAI